MKTFNPDQLVYCPLDIYIPSEKTQKIIKEIDAASSFNSAYRTCRMVPIYTQGGHSQKQQIVSAKEPLAWTQESKSCPELVNVLETVFFPFMTPSPRVLVLVTDSGGEVEIHIDCDENSINQRQHKVRYALCGAIDGLWFLSKENKRLHISGKHAVYMIDGATPHGMINQSQSRKMTVCLGAPWMGSGGEVYLKLLERSYNLFREHIINKDQVSQERPKELFQSYFEGKGESVEDPRARYKNLPRLESQPTIK